MTQLDLQSSHQANSKADSVLKAATTSSKVPNDVPAIRIPLEGEHLIEASAGTGKTWTLTGILVRLLIEAKRPPEQIIATTFTRAAAAEMRQRVHDRLIDFYQVLQWVSSLQDNPDFQKKLYPQELQVLPDNIEDIEKQTTIQKTSLQGAKAKTKSDETTKTLDPKERAELIETRENWLKEQAKLAGMSEKADDPINLYLVGFLLDHITTYPLAEAIRRTELVLTTLDKLFVGTLDSLAQKWLAEYSAETGYRQGMGITDDVQLITDAIIHDELRKFQSQLYFNQPRIYQLLQQQNKLTTIDSHREAVKKALTFISAPIDEVNVGNPFDFNELEVLLEDFKSLDLQDVEPYFDEKYRRSQGIRGRSNLDTKITYIPDIQKAVNDYEWTFYNNLSEEAKKIYDAIKSVFPDSNGKIVGFNNKTEVNHNIFINLPTIKVLKAIHDKTDELDQYLADILINLNRNIAITVRDKLASLLEERNETTFTLQMVRLNQALSGRQGQKLARYIRHHYPVALIDESQDINGEQAQMIERIYLPEQTPHNPTHEELLSGVFESSSNQANTDSAKVKQNNTFLLLVGDPKQAIYGFRGGDVANYNYMKAKFGAQIMSLNLNRRSNAQLIDALNHWFGCPQPLDSSSYQNSLSNSNVLSELGENIHYQYIEAHNQHTRLSWQNNAEGQDFTPHCNELLSDMPVSIIHLAKYDDQQYNKSEITALHIKFLLESEQTLEGRRIRPSDIGVLGRRKKELKQVEDMLSKLKVPTLVTSEVSIFETSTASDLVALMEAMLYSNRRRAINRALTSQFFGLTLREVKAMMASHDQIESVNSAITGAGGIDKSSGKNTLRYQDFITHIKEASERWQKRGILPALDHLLGKSLINPKGAWQSLASLPEGERHIMDLRHLLDVLAQYSMNMGEHELLSWFKQNIDKAPKEDWARQQPLPTESGVQLMTIHKSKGLEFPIVYVIGMDDAVTEVGSREKYGLYLYNAQELTKSKLSEQSMDWRRQLSAVKGTAENDTLFTEIETTENYSERKRLGYVAFTRASEQLYIILEDLSSKTRIPYRPAFFWLECQDKNLSLPSRLSSKIGWLENHKIADLYNQADNMNSPNSTRAYHDNSLNNDAAQTTKENELIANKVIPINYPNLNKIMPNKFFYGWAKTSFTALARQLDEQSQDVAVLDERVDDELYIANIPSLERNAGRGNVAAIASDSMAGEFDSDYFAALKPVDDIRFSFVKGANAGTFLHQIFENIDFADQTQWSGVIDKAIRDYQLPVSYASVEQQRLMIDNNNAEHNIASEFDKAHLDTRAHDNLKGWIKEVLQTPLLASNQPLQSIPKSKRFAELGFNMGLSETFRAERLNDIFRQYLPDEPDKHVLLTKQTIPHLYRYLRGEIDLVYEHAGKFYVVDYKSNYLGNSLSDYNQDTLTEAMSKAGYWLQAAIYQVALHRFLSIRLADYPGNEDKYLGAVEYVFLRGTIASRLKNQTNEATEILDDSPGQRFGLVKWEIPVEFIKALDAEFGKPSR